MFSTRGISAAAIAAADTAAAGAFCRERRLFIVAAGGHCSCAHSGARMRFGAQTKGLLLLHAFFQMFFEFFVSTSNLVREGGLQRRDSFGIREMGMNCYL